MQIEIKQGHDPSSYFWIMPVKVRLRDVIMDEDIDNRYDHEISVEEGNVECFLSYFFYKYFDKTLIYNVNRFEDGHGYKAKFGANNRFEWCLEDNFFTYTQIQRMIGEIEWAADTLENDFENPYLAPIKKDFSIFYMTDKDSPDYKNGVTDEASVKRNIACVVDFYRRFAGYMRNMMEENPDVDLISIMGP